LASNTPAPAESPAGAVNKTTVLVASSMAIFFLSFSRTALNLAIPDISHEFHADAILASWIVSAPTLTTAIFLVPFGRVADILGIKKIFTWGVIIFTVASALAAFPNSIIILIICRGVQGIGSAMIVGNCMAMVTAVYPSNDRGRALGIVFACIYIGSSMGPFLGGIFTEHLGWRSIFFFSILPGLAVIILLLWKIKGEWCESKGEKFDYVGTMIFGLGLAALMYGFSILPAILGIALVLIGTLGLFVFFRWETGNKNPILDMSIFRKNKTFVLSNFAALISYSATTAVVFLLSLYLQYIKGLGPQEAGLVLVAQPVMQVITSPFTGRLSDKVEPRLVASVGMALTCLGLLSFIFLGDNTSLARIIITLIVLGTGFALFSSPNANAVMSSVASKFYGVASASLNTMVTLGNTLSLGIAMIVMAMTIGRVEITAEYYEAFLTSTRIAFGIFSALCFSGIFVSLSRGKVR
jgi:EmrB/QacA subfamily drug resistance transporter